jgi:hypothetical protein
MKLEFPRKIFEKYRHIQISNFTKIRPAEAELLHTGGRPDVTMLIVVFFTILRRSLKVTTRNVKANEQNH